MNNRVDARQLLRLGDIDADNFGVRHRAARNSRVEHARKLNVARVARLAGDSLVRIDAGNSFADNGKLFRCLCHKDLLQRLFAAAASTAATRSEEHTSEL